VHDTAEPFDAANQHLLAAEHLGHVVAPSEFGVKGQVKSSHRAVTGLVHSDLEAAFGDARLGCNSLDIIITSRRRDADQQRVDLTGIPSGGVAGLGDEARPDLNLDIHVFLGLERGHVMPVQKTQVAHIHRPIVADGVAQDALNGCSQLYIGAASAPCAVCAADSHAEVCRSFDAQGHARPHVDRFHAYARSLEE